MRVCRLISKKCQGGLNSSRLDHYLKKKNLQFFLVKVFVITVKNNFRFKSRNISFINDKMSFWQLLRPVSVVFVTWKDIGLLVRRRSIVDLLFLVKHLFLLTILSDWNYRRILLIFQKLYNQFYSGRRWNHPLL